jgi:hypothetical protein
MSARQLVSAQTLLPGDGEVDQAGRGRGARVSESERLGHHQSEG